MPCGILSKVLYREGPPRVQPFTLLHTIFDRKSTHSYTIFIRLTALSTYFIFGRVGAYSRWALIQHFQQVYYVYFATKQVVITKREDVTNQGFCKYSDKNSVFEKSLIIT